MIKPYKKILLGMDRPTQDEIRKKFTDGGSYYKCKCFPGEIAWKHGSFIECYNKGHYDIPIYKYVWDENGRIVESLYEPKHFGYMERLDETIS